MMFVLVLIDFKTNQERKLNLPEGNQDRVQPRSTGPLPNVPPVIDVSFW
jgi:hypothetical protein